LATSQLSVYQNATSGLVPSLETIQLELSESSEEGLFAWTLTHPSRAFSEIEPVFNSRAEFLEYLSSNSVGSISSKICRLAIQKIDREWDTWVALHSELPFDERKLDNMLMAALYRIILDRDLKRCVICHAMSGLTIHHIIQKKRNVTRTAPPFGRSVPTNLVTLCRNCHAFFDPMVLV
jgi:5-methylcytosine-specific restriction endonuclease McrA